MNETMRTILGRRAIRRYRPDQISKDELNTILEAGLYAPNAGGRQSCLVVACQNAAINDELGKINKQAFGTPKPGRHVSKEQPSIIDDPQIASGFYGAPTVLIFFGPKDFIYSVADCCMMAENMMLAAYSLNIGSCMVMRAEATFAGEPGQRLQKEWGIDENFEAKAFVTLGYPDGTVPAGKPRKENRVKLIA
ncbi:nitroreductase family protein [Desulfobulbus oligotrophicus]|nr:nitroreductase family protein [Desulfobulbus oligotrophicus]